MAKALLVGAKGKWAFTVEHINQSGSLDCGNERLVILRVDGVFDDGFRRIDGGTTDHHCIGGETSPAPRLGTVRQVRAMRFELPLLS